MLHDRQKTNETVSIKMLKLEKNCQWSEEEVRENAGWFRSGEPTGEIKRKLTAYSRTNWKWYVDVDDEMWQDFVDRHQEEPVWLGDIAEPDDPQFLRVFGYRDDVYVTQEDIDESVVRGYLKEKKKRRDNRIERLRRLGNE